MYQPLSQLGRVVRPVPAMPVHAEIQEASQLPSSDDAIGQFALNRDALEIGGDFLENKWDVGAVDGNLHNDRTGLIVEEGQTMPLAHRLAFLILGSRALWAKPSSNGCQTWSFSPAIFRLLAVPVLYRKAEDAATPHVIATLPRRVKQPHSFDSWWPYRV